MARAGGKHDGWLRTYSELPSHVIAKGIRGLEKQVNLHKGWMADPFSRVAADSTADEVERLVSKKWPSDIRRIEEQIEILRGLLRERGDG